MSDETPILPLDTEPVEELVPATELPAPKRGLVHRIFVGSKGIRAGWSLLAFIALIPAIGFPIGKLMVYLQVSSPERDKSPGNALITEMVGLVMVVFATAIMARVERRSVLSYGFIDKRALPRLAGGFATGFATFSIMVGILKIGGWIVFDKVALSGWDIVKFGGIWFLASLVIGVTEEALFRGYILQTLARGLNFWWAATIISVLFGVSHLTNAGYTWLDAVHIGAAGLLLVFSLRLTGSLFWAIGMHAAWDWSGIFFYSDATDGTSMPKHFLETHATGNPLWSGGNSGPDGSMLSLLMLCLVGIGIWFLWKTPSTSTTPTHRSGPHEPLGSISETKAS
jgi:hypothetical protein